MIFITNYCKGFFEAYYYNILIHLLLLLIQNQVFQNESIIILKSLFFHYFKVGPGLGEHGKGVSLPKEQTEEDIKETPQFQQIC